MEQREIERMSFTRDFVFINPSPHPGGGVTSNRGPEKV